MRLRLQFEEGARASAGTSSNSQFLTSTSAGEGAITEATSGDVVEVEEVDLYDDADGDSVRISSRTVSNSTSAFNIITVNSRLCPSSKLKFEMSTFIGLTNRLGLQRSGVSYIKRLMATGGGGRNTQRACL